MAYKGNARRIKDALKLIFAEITYDSGSGAQPAFVSVQGSTDQQFDGYPSLRILPGELDDQKGSTHQNDHTVAYIVRIYSYRESGLGSEEEQIDLLYDLTDLVIDTLDQAWQSGSLTEKDPAIKSHLMTSQQGDWSAADTEAGALLMTDVNVHVSYVKNLT